jgi:hypothetical protein
MNLRIFLYDVQSLLSAVEAANSMMIGASMINARGKTIPPYAARLSLGCGSLATIALRAGSSKAINSQLKANGIQLTRIDLKVTTRWDFEIT